MSREAYERELMRIYRAKAVGRLIGSILLFLAVYLIVVWLLPW